MKTRPDRSMFRLEAVRTIHSQVGKAENGAVVDYPAPPE